MKLEDQVCSLELAKRLEELGIKQKSYFVWFKLKENTKWSVSENWQIDDEERFDTISAYSVAELGGMLPACIDIQKNEPFNYFWLQICKRSAKNIQYCIGYFCDTIEAVNWPSMGASILKSYDEKLADALAKMLIYLLENKLKELSC